MWLANNAVQGTWPNLISPMAFQRDFWNTTTCWVARMRISSVSCSAIGIAGGCHLWRRIEGSVLGIYLLQLQSLHWVMGGFEETFASDTQAQQMDCCTCSPAEMEGNLIQWNGLCQHPFPWCSPLWSSWVPFQLIHPWWQTLPSLLHTWYLVDTSCFCSLILAFLTSENICLYLSSHPWWWHSVNTYS